jgi:hypothetical protein
MASGRGLRHVSLGGRNMGRTGIEPVTLGLKVLQIETYVDLKKRRFRAVGERLSLSFEVAFEPYIFVLEGLLLAVLSRTRASHGYWSVPGWCVHGVFDAAGLESGGETSTSTA